MIYFDKQKKNDVNLVLTLSIFITKIGGGGVWSIEGNVEKI